MYLCIPHYTSCSYSTNWNQMRKYCHLFIKGHSTVVQAGISSMKIFAIARLQCISSNIRSFNICGSRWPQKIFVCTRAVESMGLRQSAVFGVSVSKNLGRCYCGSLVPSVHMRLHLGSRSITGSFTFLFVRLRSWRFLGRRQHSMSLTHRLPWLLGLEAPSLALLTEIARTDILLTTWKISRMQTQVSCKYHQNFMLASYNIAKH
jgi:hypothetical protein